VRLVLPEIKFENGTLMKDLSITRKFEANPATVDGCEIMHQLVVYPDIFYYL
jgi:hypothetical protein